MQHLLYTLEVLSLLAEEKPSSIRFMVEIPSDSCGPWPGLRAPALSVDRSGMETLLSSHRKAVWAEHGEQLSKIKNVLVPSRPPDRTPRWSPIWGIGLDGLETLLLLVQPPESPECQSQSPSPDSVCSHAQPG